VRLSRTTLKTLRDVRRSRWQFLAVCVATALGVAIFIGSYGSYENLRGSYARTYEGLLMADAWFQVEDAPESVVADIRTQPGVVAAEGRLIADLPVVFPGHDLPRILTRLVSLPGAPGSRERPSVNDVSVVEGSYILDATQVLLDQAFARFNNVGVGDQVEVIAPGGGTLELTVAGLVVSPEYLFAARNEQEMFSPPSQFGVAFLPYTTLASFLGMDGRISDVAIRLIAGADASVVTRQVSGVLEAYGPSQATDRTHQLSNRLLQLDLDGFRGLALVFPLLFLIVGSLAVYTLLNRLMQSQRGQIGVMRAMGYSQGAVLRHYLRFGVLVGLVGAVLGVVGGWMLADLVTRGYASSLNVPFVIVSTNWSLIAVGFCAGLGVAIVSSLLPAWSAARIPPAEAMRPPSPPHGMRSPLERLLPIMRRLPYSLKLPLRNVVRVPRRSLFTVFGVGAGVSLVLVAASLLDSFDGAVALQFDSIENYDARVDFEGAFPLAQLADVKSLQGVRSVEAIAEVRVRLSAGSRQADVLLQGLQPQADLLRVYTPGHDRIRPGGGLLVPETLASSLGLHAGDTVSVQLLTGPTAAVDLRVDGVTAQPLGSVVISRLDTAASLLGDGESGTAMLVKVDGQDGETLRDDLDAVPGVATVKLKQDVRDYIGQFSALFIVFVTIMLVFGVVLGFVVIFNSITISVQERQRELATMRVIGTSTGRILRVLTIENAIIGLLGVLLGIPIGLVVAGYFASLYQNDLIDMPLVIYARTYLLAASGALLTVLLAEVPAVRFVRRLNLAQATKELTL
jgi:putative ABC transport system permease protein